MKRRFKMFTPSRLLTAGKIILAGALIAFIVLCKQIDWGTMWHTLASMRWQYFIYGLALQWIVMLFGTHRIQILLRAQDVHMTFWRSFSYNCIGFFFSLFSLGSTGGDVVKAYYISRETDHRKTESVTIVFLDRIMGLTAVLLIAAVSLIAILWLTDAFIATIPLVYAALLLALIACAVVFTKSFWLRFALVRRAIEYTPHMLRRAGNALHQYRSHKLIALVALADSIILQLLMCVAAWLFGLGLGLVQPWYIYFVVFPLGTLIMSLPISPSGLGTGDLAFITSLERFGVEPNPALAFVILIRLALYSVSLAGFFLWIMPGTHITRKKLAVEAEELKECGQAPQQKT